MAYKNCTRKCIDAVTIQGESAILVKSTRITGGNTWHFPGNLFSSEMTPKENVEEIVLKTLGVRTQTINYLCDWEEKKGGNVIYVAAGYLTNIDGNPVINDESGISEMKRFNINELPKNMTGAAQHYIEIYMMKLKRMK